MSDQKVRPHQMAHTPGLKSPAKQATMSGPDYADTNFTPYNRSKNDKKGPTVVKG